jgi:hypothetical protein
MARGVLWPLEIKAGALQLTAENDPARTLSQEIAIGLLSALSTSPWNRVNGVDAPPVAYAAGPDGGRSAAIHRVTTVFDLFERQHRARLKGAPTIRADGAGKVRIFVTYEDIEAGGAVKTLEV